MVVLSNGEYYSITKCVAQRLDSNFEMSRANGTRFIWNLGDGNARNWIIQGVGRLPAYSIE